MLCERCEALAYACEHAVVEQDQALTAEGGRHVHSHEDGEPKGAGDDERGHALHSAGPKIGCRCTEQPPQQLACHSAKRPCGPIVLRMKTGMCGSLPFCRF